MSDINIGAITETLNDKLDRDLRNVDTTTGADVVIDYQAPTAENGYTWYRKYKSGWVEQGGQSSNSNNSGVLVTLAVAMASTDYTILVAPVNGAGYGTSGYGGDNRTTTTFKVYCNNNGGRPSWWVVCGMAA